MKPSRHVRTHLLAYGVALLALPVSAAVLTWDITPGTVGAGAANFNSLYPGHTWTIVTTSAGHSGPPQKLRLESDPGCRPVMPHRPIFNS